MSNFKTVILGVIVGVSIFLLGVGTSSSIHRGKVAYEKAYKEAYEESFTQAYKANHGTTCHVDGLEIVHTGWNDREPTVLEKVYTTFENDQIIEHHELIFDWN